jgi:plastocyanin
MKYIQGYIFLLIIFAFLAVGCSSIAQSQEQQDDTMKQKQKNITVSLKEYSIDSGKIRFIPSQEPIKVTIQNKGMSAHDFVIKDLGIDSGVILPGQSVTLEITAKDQAVFQAECTLPGHKEAGMIADVIVGE